MNFVGCLVILGTFATLCSANHLPSYIKKCSESASHFNDCIMEQANILIPKMGRGISKMHIPPMSPLPITKVSIDIGAMHLDLIDGEAYGIDHAVVTSMELDKEAKTLKIVAFTPDFVYKSKYATSGKIFILPIEGNGDFEGNLTNVEFTYIAHLDNLDMNTKKHLKMVDADFDYSYENAKFKMDDLFKGNKQLSEPVMKLINEEHQTISKEFKPVFQRTIKAIISAILNPVLEHYCYSDIILP